MYLYHRTHVENLSSIIKTNKLIASTRSWFEDKRVSLSERDNLRQFGEILIVLDKELLETDYIVIKFDYTKSMMQYSYEREWYTEKDITNISKYIVKIINEDED